MLVISGHDMVGLGYGYTIESMCLVDSIVGSRHQLDKKVILFMTSLAKRPISYSDIFHQLETSGINLESSKQMLETLNSIGALKVRRSYRGIAERLLLITRAKILRINITPISRRSAANLTSISIALFKATSFLMMLWIFACSLILAIGVISPMYFFTHSLGAYFILYLSLISHEYSHVLSLDSSSGKAAITQNRWRVGIIHAERSASIEISSAIIGPLVGAGFAIGLSFILFSIYHSKLWLSIGFIFAACHLLSLLPSFSDGWTILKTLKRKQLS